MAGSPAATFSGKPTTHFMPSRSSDPSPAEPGSQAGMAWAKESTGPGSDTDLGGQLGSRPQPQHGALGEVQPLLDTRQSGEDVSG